LDNNKRVAPRSICEGNGIHPLWGFVLQNASRKTAARLGALHCVSAESLGWPTNGAPAWELREIPKQGPGGALQLSAWKGIFSEHQEENPVLLQ